MKEYDPDPVINEVRKARHELSARFNHDPSRLIDYLMECQEQHADRLIRPEPIKEHAGPIGVAASCKHVIKPKRERKRPKASASS